MRQIYLRILFIGLVVTAGLNATERVISTLNKVDLIAIDKQNEEGHNYGTDYFAFNHNDFPVHITIELSHSINTQDFLINGAILVHPNEKSHLGWLIQNNTTMEAKWNVQWQVSKANEF